MKFRKSLLGAAIAGTLASSSMAGEVEVLHWWTSGGEAAAIAVLRDMVEDEGHTWTDFSVAGGAGENAMTVLRARAVSGNPPASAQIKGLEIQEWGDLGFLASLDSVAAADGWDDFLPEEVASVMKYDGQYVAVPVNVHRVNWMWANPEVLESAGVSAPTTLDELWEVADQLQAAGYTPIAHGGQAWQDATTFENFVLATGGPELFSRAFVDHDEDALTSDAMKEAFTHLRRITDYIDEGAPGRDWDQATAMVIRGEAGIQFMGDWAKGEFTAAGLTAGEDYLCVAFPGTDGMFTHNVDSLAMFTQRDSANQEAQATMASLVLSTEFQETFNQNKGSIPVRLDHDMSTFDECAQASMDTFVATSQAGEGLVPSMAHGMSTTSSVQGAIYDVVTAFFNSTSMTEDQAVSRLASAVRAAQ
ncbi:MAG: ABC transporter substrate-binding protein [Natronospirillum sp.]|uniref:ABC transporter substrate-binding protein n=1 Tax=Natronospirillum sp. TaxID=2812955 RepID=UPI0025D841F2|nr:ABC transporter substrate-binding protein [Natronospirillum sp.]MCH8551483.1 ABC transporter substrate-binding protein [Natronospirillum sp.]